MFESSLVCFTNYEWEDNKKATFLRQSLKFWRQPPPIKVNFSWPSLYLYSADVTILWRKLLSSSIVLFVNWECKLQHTHECQWQYINIEIEYNTNHIWMLNFHYFKTRLKWLHFVCTQAKSVIYELHILYMFSNICFLHKNRMVAWFRLLVWCRQ